MIWYERLHHPPFNPTGYNCHEHLMFWFSLFHSLSYSSFLCNFPREASPIPPPQLCSSRCSSNAVDKLPKTSRIDFLGEGLWHPKYKKRCYKGWLHFGALGSKNLYQLLSELSVPTQLMSKKIMGWLLNIPYWLNGTSPFHLSNTPKSHVSYISLPGLHLFRN